MGQLSNRLPTACGLALERGAGPRVSSVVWLKRGAIYGNDSGAGWFCLLRSVACRVVSGRM
jgi:hypothetical protein